jgi:hypothetical protein
MSFTKPVLARRDSGQALIETVLVLWILILPVLLNAINMGYFFLMVLNIQSAPHKAGLYSIMGSATPAAQLLPPMTTGTCTNCTVSYMAYQDLAATALPGTNAAVRVCRAGVCATAGTTPAGYSWPAATTDPELNSASTAPAFDLNRVDVVYRFNPLIPGTIFNLGLSGFPTCGGGSRSCCNANGTCILHRYSEMRVMN